MNARPNERECALGTNSLRQTEKVLILIIAQFGKRPWALNKLILCTGCRVYELISIIHYFIFFYKNFLVQF